MSPAKALFLLVALSAFPSVMFLALYRGLRRLQNGAMMGTLTATYGIELREITLRDAVQSVFGRERDEADGTPPVFRL